MRNPWLAIPYSDYESNMEDVGPSQMLGSLTNRASRNYAPKKFFLPGCAAGNGIEFVDNTVTDEVYALDINSDYLNQVVI
ncbi:hypothetical protein ACT29H_04530 [Thermophagus sp. OGC60D27]|uniref:hypothetical protein n=1 Tax=Thermophagus sp. OGC60D27 TaxID=3458415 RepID=UPI0040376271